ncbi:ribonuclease G [Rhodobacteraceae bacterium MBR-64]
MIGRVVALGHVAGRDAAALMVDGQLEDLALDPPEGAGPLPGAIFRGRVGRLMKGQGGVFVDLPDGASGFIRQVRGLAPGQPVLVQVSGHAEPGKAVPVATRLLFKSRYAIVTPDAPGLNIARSLHDEDRRAALTALARAAMAGSDAGLILRSACDAAEDSDVAEDIALMRTLAEAVLADVAGPPELLVDGPSAHEIAWRDWAHPAPDEVDDSAHAFDALGITDAIEALLDPVVPLPGGGFAAVEPTHALIAVDVNTGNDTSAAAGLKANIALARDLPRQLRLRGLGGQVVVDFAPMPKRDRQVLEQVLTAAFKREGAEATLAGWTPLGNYELTRRRDRLPLTETLKNPFRP